MLLEGCLPFEPAARTGYFCQAANATIGAGPYHVPHIMGDRLLGRIAGSAREGQPQALQLREASIAGRRFSSAIGISPQGSAPPFP